MALFDRTFAPEPSASVSLSRHFILMSFVFPRARVTRNDLPSDRRRRCFALPSGGPTRAAGVTAVEGNYVASSRRLLVQREKNIGQFEITSLFAERDREGQVGRMPCNGGRDRFRFRRLARFSGTGRHRIRPRETRKTSIAGRKAGFDTLHRVNAEGETGIDFFVSYRRGSPS